jgi:hypothetical protein
MFILGEIKDIERVIGKPLELTGSDRYDDKSLDIYRSKTEDKWTVFGHHIGNIFTGTAMEVLLWLQNNNLHIVMSGNKNTIYDFGSPCSEEFIMFLNDLPILFEEMAIIKERSYNLLVKVKDNLMDAIDNAKEYYSEEEMD